MKSCPHCNVSFDPCPHCGQSPGQQPKFVFGVDLDGVVADYYSGLKPIAAEWLGVSISTLPDRVSWGLPEWGVDKAPGGYKALHKFAVTQRDLFLNLPPMTGAPQALRALSAVDIRIRIITHRFYIKFFHQVAAKQTIQWLDENDIPYWDLCFMMEKSAVGANLYIEDSEKNINSLRSQNCPTIVFVNSTNEHLGPPKAHSWDEVTKLALEAKEKWSLKKSS